MVQKRSKNGKVKLTDFIPDNHNANKGTVRGLALLEDSLKENGAGRSILVDKQNRVIAGNKTLQSAVDIGLNEAIVVPTDGKQLVVVQRTDIDLDTPKGRNLAIADNRVAELDLEWDADVLNKLMDDGADLAHFFNDGELAHLLNQGDELDYGAAWQGMPEFEQPDVQAFRTIRIHFETQEAVDAFAALLGQTITEKTKYLYFPKQVRDDYGVAHES